MLKVLITSLILLLPISATANTKKEIMCTQIAKLVNLTAQLRDLGVPVQDVAQSFSSTPPQVVKQLIILAFINKPNTPPEDLAKEFYIHCVTQPA